jgi:predicted ATP-grasp superfamily ATP-dependent carboligase
LSAESVLIVALSARALAQAAVRAGYRPVALDLFGDVDTRASAPLSAILPGDLASGFAAEPLIEAAQRLAPSSGLVYGAGLERCPELLEQLADRRPLWGNRPSVLRDVKDPYLFAGLMDRLGLPRPEIRMDPPGEAGWLVKTIGAAGGSHVRPASAAIPAAPDHYFQRRVAGRPVSCLFLANGREAMLLGWSEQWPAPDADHPFRFGGAAQPAHVPESVTRPIAAALSAMVRETGLLGLNSLDLVVGESDFHLLEINPRPGASLDIFDDEGAGALFGHHIKSCEGRSFSPWQAPRRATAAAIVYADALLRIPTDISYPAWMADRPAPGAHIEPGAPICTVMAEASDVAAARLLVLARGRWVLDALAAKEAG